MDAIDTLLKADPERKTYERHLRGNYEGAYQLLKGGIATPSDYSQAREALLNLGDPNAGQKTQADRIADAERALVGLKIPGFFPTPTPVVHRLLELADIVAGDRVLEPSAGKGNIADGVRQACPDTQLHACEIQSSLREILKLKGYALVGSNFLDLEPDSSYDTVVMNPPFENFQDIQHVRHAYNFLKPGGRLVAVMGEGAFFRQDTIAAEFRTWLANSGGYEERLPEGSFKASGTGVAARIVVIDKPALQPSQPLPLEEKIEGFTQLSLF
jgi:hypothetical protein